MDTTDTLQIPDDDLKFTFARSGGPGGQNVNKVSLKAILHWDFEGKTTVSSANFPITTGSYQITYGGGTDVFVTKVNAAGTTLVYSTYLGGSGTDQPFGLALDTAGNAFVAGSTSPSGATPFPTTTGALQTTAGGQDGFVTKFNAAGTALVYSTFLGGGGSDRALGLALTSDGQATISGDSPYDTGPTGYPATTTFSNATFVNFNNTATLARLSSDGSSLVYAGYVTRGSGRTVAVDLNNDAYIAGETPGGLPAFPNPGAFQTTHNGGSTDGFVAKIPGLAPPVITAVSIDSGYLATDFITKNQNLTISGIAPPSVTVRLFVDTVPIGTTTSNSSGSWSFNHTGTTLAEGVYALTAQSESGSTISRLSPTQLLTVDLTAPAVTLTVPANTASFSPVVQVQASDLVGFPPAATVTLDVDTNNDGDFVDAGETGHTTGTLANGAASIHVNVSAISTYRMQARVTDLAGNEGTSGVATITIIGGVTWALADAAIRTSELSGGNPLPQLGDLQASHPLDLDKSPGAGQSGNPYLIYNSSLTGVKPIVQAKLLTDNSAALPATITAQLTWNGTAQTPVDFSTAGFARGDELTLAVQDTVAVTTTGRNTWTLTVTIPGAPPVVKVASGVAYIRAEDSSPYAAGWTLSNVSRLVDILPDLAGNPAGKLWLYGTGEVRFFQGPNAGTPAPFTSPPEDNGALVLNADLTYTYTAPSGYTIDFDALGYQTNATSADGFEVIGYTYDPVTHFLTGQTAIDGQTSTFTYSGGLLSSIAAGSRTWSFTMTGGDLTQIADPDSKTEAFGYSSHLMVDETRGSLANHWAFSSARLLTTLRWGNSSSPSTTTLASANSRGLGGFYLGDAVATATDPLNNKTVSRMDLQGRLLAQTAADGGQSKWTRDGAGRVATAVDPNGRTTTFTRDSLGYVTQETLPDGNNRQYAYQAAFHALTVFTDERASKTTYVYDAAGHLVKTIDALAAVTTYVVSATTGLVTSEQDPLTRVTTYAYDTSRRVQSVTTAFGSTTYGYDTVTGEVAAITDALNHTTSIAHDNSGRVTGRTTADTVSESWSYNSAGLLDTHTDKLGIQNKPGYDAFGRGLVAAATQGFGTGVARTELSTHDNAGRTIAQRDAAGALTAFGLDAVGRTLVTTDSRGNRWRNVYDLAGQLTDSFDAAGARTHLAHNARGWVTATTDARGNVATNVFDAAGNITQAADQLGHAWNTTFDKLHRAKVVSDPLGHAVTTTWWANGLLQDVTVTRGGVAVKLQTQLYPSIKQLHINEALAITGVTQTTIQTLDALTNVISEKDGLNHIVTFTRDAVNQVVATTDALNHVTTLVRDAMSRVTQVIDALGKVTTLTRDALGQVTGSIDATGKTMQAVFDAAGRMVASIDGAGKVSRSAFDGMGNAIAETDADGFTAHKQFDVAGRMVAYIDALGNRTRWEFDKAGNKIKEIDPSGNVSTWAYDAANRLTGHTDRLGRSETYAYLNNDLLQTEVWKNSAGTAVNTLTYTYNESNELLTAADTNGTITMTRDPLGRLATRTDPWGLTLTLTHDKANRLTQAVDSLGGTVTNVYDNADRITDRKFSDTSARELGIKYSYNARDEVTQESRYSNAAETTLVGTTDLAYDDAGRTTGITHKDGATPTPNTLNALAYTYDIAGRVATETSTLGPSRTYTYDNAGQLTGDGSNNYAWDAEGNRATAGWQVATGNKLSTDTIWNYTYDAEGNETQKTNIADGKVWQYGYDNANRLTTAEHKPSAGGAVDQRVQFKYDVLGNRIEKSVDADGDGAGGAVVTRFAYDWNGNAWADLDGNNGNALVTRRLYGNAMDVVFARIGAGGTAWYLDDRLGSIRDIASSTGLLIDHRDWDSFGILTNETSPANGDRYGWTSREVDVELGLQYNRARYYDPSTGRWLSQDPLGFGAGDSNLYRYVNNAPTYATDPRGLPTGVQSMTGQPIPGHKYSPEEERLLDLLGTNPSKSGQSKASNKLIVGRTKYDELFSITVAPRVVIDPFEAITKSPPPITDHWDAPPHLDREPGFEATAQAKLDTMRLFLRTVGMVPGPGKAAMAIVVVLDIENGDYGQAAFDAIGFGLAKGPVSGGLGGPGVAPTAQGMRNSRQWLLTAPEGATRPNVAFTYVDDLLAREGLLGAQSTASGIEIQTGLPRLVELGVLRHEYGHQVLTKYSGGVSNLLYYNTNSFRVLEELGVHLYATQNPVKAFIHSVRYIEPGQLAREIVIVGGTAYVVNSAAKQKR